jgi:hypothetical protein
VLAGRWGPLGVEGVRSAGRRASIARPPPSLLASNAARGRKQRVRYDLGIVCGDNKHTFSKSAGTCPERPELNGAVIKY